jgi:tetratricopeptide (TPR) repeat protein
MSIAGRYKAIEAGKLESYDIQADPGEANNLGAGANLPAGLRKALDDYPLPSPGAQKAADTLDAEARARLAALGYVSASAAPVIRKDAPRPADMIGLLPLIDRASVLFGARKYADAIPVFEEIHQKDPFNLDAILRLATAHSALGHDAAAEALFQQAARAAPESPDVSIYLGLHYARTKDWRRAVPLLERAIAAGQDRIAVLETLADLRRRGGQPAEAVSLLQRAYARKTPDAPELVALGAAAMEAGDTSVALDAFGKARALQGAAFDHDLELGVLYMDTRRFEEARTALDRVPPGYPAYPMALFKRAQVSVLLREADAPARIALAKKKADAVTRPLIEREKLFK